MNYAHAVFTGHALEEMLKRQVTIEQVQAVLQMPETILTVRVGRVIAQGMSGQYLLRIVIDDDRQPPEIVTVYRTSNLKKYRQQP